MFEKLCATDFYDGNPPFDNLPGALERIGSLTLLNATMYENSDLFF